MGPSRDARVSSALFGASGLLGVGGVYAVDAGGMKADGEPVAKDSLGSFRPRSLLKDLVLVRTFCTG